MSYNSASPRFKSWILHLVFAIIILFSVVAIDTDDDEVNASKKNKAWGTAFAIIIVIIAVGIVLMHLTNVGGVIIGSKPEAVIPLVLASFWIGMACVVTGPMGGLAIDNDGAVYAGNLYYFTWAGFFISIYIFASVIEEVYAIDIAHEMNSRSTSFMYWVGLLVTSLVVMAVCADIFNRLCDFDDNDIAFCNRCALGIAAGTIGTILSLVIVALKLAIGVAPFLLETGFCVVLVLLFIFEVGYITDDEAPGAPLGNLYYFSWASFAMSLMVGKACYDDFLTAQNEIEEPEPLSSSGPRVISTPSEESDDTPGAKNGSTPEDVEIDPEQDI